MFCYQLFIIRTKFKFLNYIKIKTKDRPGVFFFTRHVKKKLFKSKRAMMHTVLLYSPLMDKSGPAVDQQPFRLENFVTVYDQCINIDSEELYVNAGEHQTKRLR